MRVALSALCVSALCVAALLGGCGDDEDGGPSGPPWHIVGQGLEGALISVSGTSAEDVWTVGGDGGQGPEVRHLTGGQWSKLDTGTQGDLWWVFPFESGVTFIGGDDGTILRHDSDGFQRMDTPVGGTVFGIWGPAEDDLWAVGGDASQAGSAFLWRSSGGAWTAVEALPAETANLSSLFKVWGRSASDVFIVGERGTTIHWDGAAYELVDAGTDRSLLTVHAPPDGAGPFAVVGGGGRGEIHENDGTGWVDVTPSERISGLFGVHVRADGSGWAVGMDGLVVQRRAVGDWAPIDTGLDLYETFHAVWVDPEGGVWGAGGDLVTPPLVEGVLVYRGAATPPVLR